MTPRVWGFSRWLIGKESTCKVGATEDAVLILGLGRSPGGGNGNPLQYSSTEQFHFHFSLSCIGEGNGNPLQCSCLENPRDGGAWWAAVYRVAQSRTRLKRLSSKITSGFPTFWQKRTVKPCSLFLYLYSHSYWKHNRLPSLSDFRAVCIITTYDLFFHRTLKCSFISLPKTFL